MKKLNYIFFVLIGVLVLSSSCKKQIDDKINNPNLPTTVPPDLILGTVLTQMSGTGENGAGGIGALGGVNSWDVVGGWNQYHCQNYNYYGNNIYSWTDNSAGTDNGYANESQGPFNSYLLLKNVVQMEQEQVTRSGKGINPYEAIGRFVKAYYFYNLTSLMGDVPLTQALQSPAVQTPAYTPSEQVFAYVLNQLDTANSDFATLIANQDQSLTAYSSQDIYYGGNLTKWQKLVNSFKLRVCIALSNKASDQTLNVPSRFAAVLSNPAQYPIFTGQADDFQFNYNPGGSNTFSTYPLDRKSVV